MIDTDGALLDAVIAGDADACWELWQRHSAELYAICFAEMRRHRADAEDALARSMLKAVVKLPRFAPRIVDPAAWLRRLTRNVCFDIQRERARARIAEEAFPWEILHDAPEEEDAPQYEAADLVEQLPDRLRDVFLLRVLHGMRYSDIAARLQLTPAAARKRVQQARRLMNAWRDGRIVQPAYRPSPVSRDPAPLVPHRIRIRSGAGEEKELEILVSRRPSRARQKIATLRAYVERHPGGWKKRLELAELLYASGAWPEAFECYRFVLQKRPWLHAVAARIDEIRRELENFT